MKLFWNLACEIFTCLKQTGINVPPSHRFFNQPKITNDSQMLEEIHVDISFTEDERLLIRQAAKDFEYFSNDQVSFDLRFDLDPTDEEAIKNQAVMLRVDKTYPLVVEMDGYYNQTILGLCMYREEHDAVYMVYDRLSNPITFRTTVIHELGHFMGLDHTLGRSIMYKHNMNNVLYPTYIDAVEFAKTYDCKPEELRYFKII